MMEDIKGSSSSDQFLVLCTARVDQIASRMTLCGEAIMI